MKRDTRNYDAEEHFLFSLQTEFNGFFFTNKINLYLVTFIKNAIKMNNSIISFNITLILTYIKK